MPKLKETVSGFAKRGCQLTFLYNVLPFVEGNVDHKIIVKLFSLVIPYLNCGRVSKQRNDTDKPRVMYS